MGTGDQGRDGLPGTFLAPVRPHIYCSLCLLQLSQSPVISLGSEGQGEKKALLRAVRMSGLLPIVAAEWRLLK